MERLIPELIDMRSRAAAGSVSRRLAERCLELCLQEVTANDERFDLPPVSALEDLIRTVSGAGG